MEHTIKAIFWDNDGVLVDTERLYFEATRQVLASVDVHLDHGTYREFFLKQSQGAWHLAAEQGLSAVHVETLRLERNQVYSELLRQQATAIDGAEMTLQRLTTRFTMGVVTTSHRDHFDIIHDRTGFRQYFDFILTREDYGQSKPDPEPYLCALEQVGCQPEECVVVEDSERGLLAAHAAGLRCWVIPTALNHAGDFRLADRVLGHISEVVTHLQPYTPG